MGCGCKKRQQSTQPTQPVQPTPQAINISFAEQTSSTLTETQESLVNQIVDKLRNVSGETN